MTCKCHVIADPAGAVAQRVEGSSLSKKGDLRFVLSHAWDCALLDIPCQPSCGTCVSQADLAEFGKSLCDT